jgi:hypothetical protein
MRRGHSMDARILEFGMSGKTQALVSSRLIISDFAQASSRA